MHKNSQIKHSVFVQKCDRMFANSKIKHFKAYIQNTILGHFERYKNIVRAIQQFKISLKLQNEAD